jgi:hypothetical protein
MYGCGRLQYRSGGQGRGRGASPQAAYRHHVRSGVAVVLIAVAVTAMAACSPAGQSAPPLPSRPPAISLPGGSAAPVSAAGCLARRIDGPLPVWARSGFHPPSMPIGHVMGLRGDIVAILWAGQNRRCMPRRCLTWETKSCGCRGSPTSPERRSGSVPCSTAHTAPLPWSCPMSARHTSISQHLDAGHWI